MVAPSVHFDNFSRADFSCRSLNPKLFLLCGQLTSGSPLFQISVCHPRTHTVPALCYIIRRFHRLPWKIALTPNDILMCARSFVLCQLLLWEECAGKEFNVVSPRSTLFPSSCIPYLPPPRQKFFLFPITGRVLFPAYRLAGVTYFLCWGESPIHCLLHLFGLFCIWFILRPYLFSRTPNSHYAPLCPPPLSRFLLFPFCLPFRW